MALSFGSGAPDFGHTWELVPPSGGSIKPKSREKLCKLFPARSAGFLCMRSRFNRRTSLAAYSQFSMSEDPLHT
jgi:hypothetical protein